MNLFLDSIFSYYYPVGDVYSDFECLTHECIYFINGEGEIITNGKKIVYKSNDILVSKIGDIKSAHCFKKTNYICIRFTGDLDSELILHGLFNNNNDDVLKLFLTIQKEYKQQKLGYFDMCNAKLLELSITLRRLLDDPIEDERIYSLIRRIDEEHIFSISVEDMAKESTYSYDSFRQRFKKITGKSPTDYIIDKRIEHSCKLLQESDNTCTEIAQICGFSSSAQFSAMFKAKTGTNPKNYRK